MANKQHANKTAPKCTQKSKHVMGCNYIRQCSDPRSLKRASARYEKA